MFGEAQVELIKVAEELIDLLGDLIQLAAIQ